MNAVTDAAGGVVAVLYSLFWMYLAVLVAVALAGGLWILALPAIAKMEQRIGAICLAIWAAFIGASVWVFAPLMVASVFGDNRNGIALALQRLSFHEFSGVDAWGALVVRTIQNEVGVAAVAAVAWVLAEFLKPRA
jgi:hypothetical protein